MSEERLWKFRKPEWMNSVVARSAGVYAAGALVCGPLIEGESLRGHPLQWKRRVVIRLRALFGEVSIIAYLYPSIQFNMPLYSND